MYKKSGIFILVASAIILLGCGNNNDSDCAPGTEGCRCAEGDECNEELTCASNLCVDLNDSSSETGVLTNTNVDVPGMWVVGSHPDYHWDHVPATDVPYELLTHLALSFLEPVGTAGSYSFEITGYGPQTLTAWKAEASKYIAAAHAANVKVLVDIGGEGGADSFFLDVCQSAANLSAFAEQMTAFMQDLGLDGIDLDWEGAAYDADCAADILLAWRSAWPDGIIVTAVGPLYGGTSSMTAGSGLAVAADAIDALMLMSYIPPDQTWTWWVVPVPVTPLHGAETPWGEIQSYSIDADFEGWTGLGIPASKIVMGVGGFGVAWADTNNDGLAPNAPYTNYNELATDPVCTEQYNCNQGAAGEIAPVGCSDNQITQQWVDTAISESNGKLTLKTDDVGAVTYWGTPATNDLATVSNPCGNGTINVGSIYYESDTSMKTKKAYVAAHNMRGMEFWTLSQMKNATGDYPILEALQ